MLTEVVVGEYDLEVECDVYLIVELYPTRSFRGDLAGESSNVSVS